MTSEQQCPLHETAGHEFYLDGFGNVIAKDRKDGGMLKSQSVEALLLLDIAQSLADIRRWGVAQDQDGGQRTYDARLRSLLT